PGETAEIEILTLNSSQKGVSSEVSVAVVDEAIYQIREDQNPALATFFYHPRVNNVSTVFSAAYRFFGYSEEKRLQLALNAKQNPALAALKEEESRSRERFKDTTYWSAKVTTNAAGRAVVKVPLAENITTWRVTARAVTSDTKVGQAKTTFIAKKYLMMNAGLPSYMIRGNMHTVVANVTNLTEKEMSADVTALVKGAKISGAGSGKITVGAGKTEQVYFELTPSESPDTAQCMIDLQVKGNGLSDGSRHLIPLRFFGRESVIPAMIRCAPGADVRTASIVMPAKFENAGLTLRLSAGSGEALKQSLDYLADYPYGCIEQTMSRFMPLLAAKQAGYINAKLKNELPAMTEKGIKLIREHLNDDGGFGWYGETGSDPMMSAYVYRGLVTAVNLDSSIDKYAPNRTRYYLYSALDRGIQTPFSKAYILFCLSEGGKLKPSMADSLVKDTKREGIYTRALTALVLINQGQKDKAQGIMQECIAEYKKSQNPAELFQDKESWDSDPVEGISALLTAAVRLGSYPEISEQLASDLVALRNGMAWKNSRDTAWAVLALSEKLKKYKESGESSSLTISVNGTSPLSVRVSSAEVEAGTTVITVPAALLKSGANEIKVEKNGGGSVYAAVMASCTDRSGQLSSLSNGFRIERSYYKVDAETTDDGIDLSLKEALSFKAGDLVMVALRISKRSGSGEYLMVEDAIPPGFSVVKQDGDYYSNAVAKEYSQRQVYDDRAAFFIRGPSSGAVVRYFLRADIPGSYKSLPAGVSLMYYPDVNGSTSDTHLEVAK
ncbi:MAG: alpha-2-macroglobulin family protein, partial [Spirochaetota bacterium]